MSRESAPSPSLPSVTAGRVLARPPSPAEFASFGAFLEPPEGVGERAHFGEWLEPVVGLALQSHLNRVVPSALPLTIDRVECHLHAAQVFVPVGVSRYVVTVLPSDATGHPDPAGARSFVVPGTVGVAYRAGTWHAGITVLDHEASFAVLMWRGREDDDRFADIAPLKVHV